MRKVVFFFVALTVLLVAAAAAQDTYQLNYYSNRNNTAALDQTTRLINPGTVGTPIGANEGALCANIYVFDATQEMQECCSCAITANGILAESLLANLTQNPLTGFPASNSGVIKVVSTTAHAGLRCGDETNLDGNVTAGLLGWQTHVQQPSTGIFVTTEDGFKASILTRDGTPQTTEREFLSQACSFVQYLGTGKGKCTCSKVS